MKKTTKVTKNANDELREQQYHSITGKPGLIDLPRRYKPGCRIVVLDPTSPRCSRRQNR